MPTEHREVGSGRVIGWREWLERHIADGGNVDTVEGQGHNQLAGAAADLLRRYDELVELVRFAVHECEDDDEVWLGRVWVKRARAAVAQAKEGKAR